MSLPRHSEKCDRNTCLFPQKRRQMYTGFKGLTEKGKGILTLFAY